MKINPLDQWVIAYTDAETTNIWQARERAEVAGCVRTLCYAAILRCMRLCVTLAAI